MGILLITVVCPTDLFLKMQHNLYTVDLLVNTRDNEMTKSRTVHSLRWALIKTELRENWVALFLVIAFIGLFFIALYIALTDKVIDQRKILATVVAFHQVQTELGSNHAQFVLKTLSGETVQVQPRVGTPFLKDQKAELLATEWRSGQITYEFLQYR